MPAGTGVRAGTRMRGMGSCGQSEFVRAGSFGIVENDS
jgi:hypothetical protein